MTNAKGLKDLVLNEMRDLYDAEKQLTKALPKLAGAATSADLQSAINSHLEETRTHVERLEQAFAMLDESPRGKHCAGIAGIIEEGSDLLREEMSGAARDAGIIAGGQRAEHYEIAAYGSLIAWANTLGQSEVAALLGETLEEEKAADEKLSELAEGGINRSAAGASGDAMAYEEDEEAEQEEEEVTDDEETMAEPRPTSGRSGHSRSTRRR